jgi:hypothetical protein
MQPSDPPHQRLDDDAFRDALREVLRRSGRSMRSLSLAMGRDPGYVAALLDPTRPSRARPTPDDLVELSDATGIPLMELLEALWAIPARRIADEVAAFGPSHTADTLPNGLSSSDRRTVADLAEFLAARRLARRRAGSDAEDH